MELELGFKISKTLDDYSSANFRVSKDKAGTLFVSKETDTMFVLTAHLKGYKKEKIKIEVNKDGTRIAICGERPVQEMVMVNWQMHKKEPQMRGFRKAFNIPKGVNLDKIEARFNEAESFLTITMPKLVKELLGLKIEEITEYESLRKGKEILANEKDEIVNEISSSKGNNNGEQIVDEAKDIVDDKMQELESDNLQETSIVEHLEEKDIGEREGEDGKREKGKESVVEKQANEEIQTNDKESKLCVPVIAGAAFIVSIIVFVMHIIRANNAPSKKKS